MREFEALGVYGIFTRPVGDELSHGSYAIGISLLLLLMALLTFRKDFKQVLKIMILLLLFVLALVAPLFRMIFPIYAVALISADIDNSLGLKNIAEVFTRFINSLSYLSGYALIFFLLAFSFSQADGAFRYPLTTQFMPAERVDKVLEQGRCIGEETGFSAKDFRRYAGYLKYREVYSGVMLCGDK